MTIDSFYNFSKVSKEEWVEQVKRDLKGKGFDQTLVNKLWGELEIKPFYCEEDISEFPSSTRFHEPAKLPGFPPRIWNNVVSVYPTEEKKSNQEILLALENGADAIAIHLEGTENLHEILKGVMTEFIQIYFIPLESPRHLFNQINDWINSLQVQPSMLKGAILWSPTSDLVKRNSDFPESILLGAEMIERFSSFREFYPMALDIAKYADSGANGIQQSFLGLGEMIEMMDSFIKQAVSPAMVFENMIFYSSVGELFFAEIAKLKAFRTLLVDLALNMGIEINPSSLHFLVATSSWSKSLLDTNSNLIRQTYEAMSAILGGANSIWVKAILGKNASQLEKRIARNVSSILKEESYLDKVMDPAAGSYYLENLEEEIKTQVLKKLEELENDGGWLKSFESRKIHDLVREERSKVQKQFLESEVTKVGANKFQLKSEKGNCEFEVIKEKDFELKASRATYLLENKIFEKL